MSYDFSSSMNRLTDLYLDTNSYSKSIGSSLKLGEEAKDKFGSEFAQVFDSLQAMRTLDDAMRTRYAFDHKDDLKSSVAEKSSAMTFSKGSSRILDMLTDSITDSMNEKVNTVMSNALKNL